MKRLLVLFCFLVGCPVPQPVPVPPGPQPVADAARKDAPASDIFTAKIFDCHAGVVAVERESASSDVSYCLAGSTSASVDACILKLGQYNNATVACLIRDLGADANAAVLAGSSDTTARVWANNARAWIIEHAIGYR